MFRTNDQIGRQSLRITGVLDSGFLGLVLPIIYCANLRGFNEETFSFITDYTSL